MWSRELAAVDGSTPLLFVAISFTGCGGVLINNRSSLQANVNKSFPKSSGHIKATEQGLVALTGWGKGRNVTSAG